MSVPAQRREEIRSEARSARAESARVHATTVRLLQQSRRLAEILSGDPTGVRLRTAFEALPAAAALVDGDGRVVAVNPAWNAVVPLNHDVPVASHFGTAWSALTGETFVETAVSAVLETSTPAQAEVTVPDSPPRRMIVQIGPATLPWGTGALVMLVDITAQYDREQRLLFEATHDSLTGVANRVRLQEGLADALDRLRRYGERFALLYLDLDDFKALNDRYGHATGDEVLRQIGRRWARLVRTPDLLARVGGDEFVVVVQHVDDLETVAALGSRLIDSLDEPFVIGDAQVSVSVTIGYAAPPPDASAEYALGMADQAMYRSKRERGTTQPTASPAG